MPKVVKELSAVEVKRLNAPGLYAVGGVTGLFLQVGKGNARSWILRILIGDKRRDIGLGGFPSVTLSQAREYAREMRDKVRQGIDPVEEKRQARAQLVANSKRSITFDQCAEQYIESAKDGWKNPKHAQQWENTISKYVSPVFGSLPVSQIDLTLILKVLEPIWKSKNETASRLRGRIESVLAYATTRGYREGENPAQWRGHLDTVLPKPSKVKSVKHHPALAFYDAPAFIADLRKREGSAAKALEFCILTAARSGEVRDATWNEIDLKRKEWVIRADRMKAGKEHRIPLSKTAVDLLEDIPHFKECELVFPSPTGKVLSDMAMTSVIRKMHEVQVCDGNIGYIDKSNDNRVVTVHGFRSTFRDWAGETTAYPREVIEHALAHQLSDKAEAAYARGSMFDKRRRLMEDWATQLDQPQSQQISNVTSIRK